tara:strand:- start:169 stop:663 length:495 start_codon:yes stop_codon:yes gene_type:complete
MIAETLAGISLFKAAVDGIKSAIGTANDVSDIAGYIDNLFEGEKQVQKLRSKKSGVGGVADQFGVKSVATEVINAKLAKEQMQEIASMIDMRFGHGTWKSITEERAKRIREAKEAAAAARKEEIRKQKELEDNIKTALGIFVLIAVVVGLFFFLIASVAAALNV